MFWAISFSSFSLTSGLSLYFNLSVCCWVCRSSFRRLLFSSSRVHPRGAFSLSDVMTETAWERHLISRKEGTSRSWGEVRGNIYNYSQRALSWWNNSLKIYRLNITIGQTLKVYNKKNSPRDCFSLCNNHCTKAHLQQLLPLKWRVLIKDKTIITSNALNSLHFEFFSITICECLHFLSKSYGWHWRFHLTLSSSSLWKDRLHTCSSQTLYQHWSYWTYPHILALFGIPTLYWPRNR